MKLTSTLSGGRRRRNVLLAQTLDSIGHRRTAATLALTQDQKSTCSTLAAQKMRCPHGARFFSRRAKCLPLLSYRLRRFSWKGLSSFYSLTMSSETTSRWVKNRLKFTIRLSTAHRIAKTWPNFAAKQSNN